MYTSIINIGVKNTHNRNETKRIKLLNTYCLIWLHSSLIFIFLDFTFKPPKAYEDIITHIIASIIISAILFLNHINKTFIAKTLLIILCFAIFTLLSFNLKYSAYTIIYFAIIPTVTLSLFENNLLAYISFILSILFFNWSDIFLDPSFDKSRTLRHLLLLKDPSAFGLFLSIFLIVLYFKKLNTKNENLLAIERDNALSDKIILEKQETELRELNEFKSHFFINLSHEIRTPVTLIKGYVSKITIKEAENKKNLSIVNNQIQQVENILNSILDLSKLDENKLILERNHIEIIPFLNKHYSDFKGLFQKKNIAFNLNFNIYNITIHMDANLMSKSINNLLSNALKFTSKNGTVNINVELNDNLEINIIDNGIGIGTEDLDKIFNRFYQAKNHITQSQGSGIGLSFSKSIIDAHEFSISVTSIPNVNTNFKVLIPKEFISTTTLSNNINLASYTKGYIAEKKATKNIPTILIVDDHEQLRKYLVNTLQQYNIIEAENGKEALNILKNNDNEIDILLTDYMMPIMDGEALVKEVKKMGIKIPIIVLTARVDDFAKLNMLRIGVDGYLNKPFIEEELQLFVKNSLRLYQNILENQDTLSTQEKTELNESAQKFNLKLTNYIIDNIAELDLSTQNIADYLNISQSTLNRRVKSLLGQTTKQFILQVKIEKARELHITNPYLSKKEIGFNVGIKNTSYLFKKIAENYGKHYEKN